MKSLFFILLCTAFSFNAYSQTQPTIRLRCSSTISDNPPLWVVVFKKKSYILNDPSSTMINPNTIEKVELLKDAAATAIYGVRAANGVIVVTIKNADSRKEFNRLKPYLKKG